MRAAATAVLGFTANALFSSKSAEAAAPPPGVFSPEEFRSFPLISSYDESPNTKIFRFALPEADNKCNLVSASCIVFKYDGPDGKPVIRPYTPISRVDQTGYFEVLIKKYKDSKMGNHVHSLKRGDTIAAKGPIVKLPIRSNQYRSIGMIGGGTGIAPLYQVAREVLSASRNQTEVNLIYASRRKEDVLLGNELNELMTKCSLFAPYYVLSQAPSNWMGGIGHVSAEMIKSFMPAPDRSSDSIILVCGPPGFMKSVSGDKDFSASPPTQGELGGLLKDMGYPQKMVFKF